MSSGAGGLQICRSRHQGCSGGLPAGHRPRVVFCPPMTSWVLLALLCMLQEAPAPRATVSAQAFVGTWVGTQSWAIDAAPPGARQDQPVSVTIELVDGKIAGSMTPFMGGQDGATFTSAEIVGDELQASAVVGRP